MEQKSIKASGLGFAGRMVIGGFGINGSLIASDILKTNGFKAYFFSKGTI